MVQPFIPNSVDAAITEQAEPDSEDFEYLRNATAYTGIVSGCVLSEDPVTPDMTVDVTVGVVRIGGQQIAVSAQAGNAITAAHGSLTRIDLVSVNASGTVVVTDGTAAAEPVAPALPATSCQLGQVYVPATDTAITDAQIVAKRTMVPAATVFDVTHYGAVGDDGSTDNSAAFQAAIDDAVTVHGSVYIPAASGWYEAHDLDLDGAWGLTIEGDGEGSEVRNTGGSESIFLVGFTSTVSNMVMRNLRLTSSVAAKACLEIDGMYSCKFENVMMNSYVATARNVMGSGLVGWTGIFDSTWENCSFSCDGQAQSVPIFEIIDLDSDKFNSNTIRGGRVTGSTSATSVLFSFSSQHTNSYHYQNTIAGVNFEIPNYGAIHCEGANGWTFDTIGGYDQDATMSASFIRLGKHASGNESVGCHIVNCTNISLQSRSTFYDIETQGDYHTIINSGGHDTSGLLDFNDENVVVIGCGRSTLTGTANALILDYDEATFRGDLFVDSIKGSTDNTDITLAPHGTGNVTLSAANLDVGANEIQEVEYLRFSAAASTDYFGVAANVDDVLAFRFVESGVGNRAFFTINGEAAANPGDLLFESPTDGADLLLWDESDDQWEYSKDIDMQGNTIRDANRAVEYATATTLDWDDFIVNMESAAATRAVTLPDNATYDGKAYVVHRDGANNVTVTCAGSDTWDDTNTVQTLATDGASIGFYSIGDGEWKIVGTSGTVTGS